MGEPNEIIEMPPQLPVGVCIVAVIMTTAISPHLFALIDVAKEEGIEPKLVIWNSPGKRLLLLEYRRMPCDDGIPPEQSALWQKIVSVLPPEFELDVQCMRGAKVEAEDANFEDWFDDSDIPRYEPAINIKLSVSSDGKLKFYGDIGKFCFWFSSASFVNGCGFGHSFLKVNYGDRCYPWDNRGMILFELGGKILPR